MKRRIRVNEAKSEVYFNPNAEKYYAVKEQNLRQYYQRWGSLDGMSVVKDKNVNPDSISNYVNQYLEQIEMFKES